MDENEISLTPTIASESTTTETTTTKSVPSLSPRPSQLGGEPSLLDPKDEERGVQEMLKALTEEEKAQLADDAMVIRYFRAEKVSYFIASN